MTNQPGHSKKKKKEIGLKQSNQCFVHKKNENKKNAFLSINKKIKNLMKY